jgi:hypothetical protein
VTWKVSLFQSIFLLSQAPTARADTLQRNASCMSSYGRSFQPIQYLGTTRIMNFIFSTTATLRHKSLALSATFIQVQPPEEKWSGFYMPMVFKLGQ